MTEQFDGIWIPREMCDYAELTWPEKLLICYIRNLDNGNGCFASNRFFQGKLGIGERRIQQIIERLKGIDMVEVVIAPQDHGGSKRYITLSGAMRFYPRPVDWEGGTRNKFHHININNNKEINKTSRLPSTVATLVARFFFLHKAKTKELTGKSVGPGWGGKEGRLLKQDIELHGEESLQEWFLLFFSDKEQSVADFTRYKEKAGYSYSVFHGMIPKMSVSRRKGVDPCAKCMGIGRHYPDCDFAAKVIEEDVAERDEIMKAREEGNIDISGMFKDKIRRKG